MSTGMYLDKGEVTSSLDMTNLLAVGGKLERVEWSSYIFLLAGPLEGFSPGFVAEPVADVIGITLILVS